MPLFDTHFHCDKLEISPQDYLLEARSAGTEYFLASGFDLESSRSSRKFCAETENSWFSAGVHPHDADKFDGDMGGFTELAKDAKFVAVGETGLDYYYDHSDRKKQISVFGTMLDFALSLSRPAVVHCRGAENDDQAYSDAYGLLKDFSGMGGRFVLHCYAGNAGWTDKFASIGSYFGISGIITFPKAENIRTELRRMPPDRILLETDAPYLAPVPFRGKKNKSAYLIKTAEALSACFGTNLEKTASITTANAFSLFKLKDKFQCKKTI